MRPIVVITIIVAIFLGLVIFWLAGGPGVLTPDAAQTDSQRDSATLAESGSGDAATRDATAGSEQAGSADEGNAHSESGRGSQHGYGWTMARTALSWTSSSQPTPR